MRKLLFLLLCSLILTFWVSADNIEAQLAAQAEENKNENGFIYRIENGNAILYGYDGSKLYISLPESIEDCPVTEIRSFAGIYKDGVNRSSKTSTTIYVEPVSRIQSIVIPKSIIKIQNGAFAHLESLTELIVDAENPIYQSKNNCIIEIATETIISGCRGSRIPETAKIIGESAFKNAKIKSITIPEGITQIDAFAFSWCDELHTVKLPGTLTHIGEYAFNYCDSIARLTIPMSVCEIGSGAFIGCTSLNSITVAEDNPTFYAEERCILTRADKRIVATVHNAKLPKDFTAVDAHAFDSNLNEYIEELILPETLTKLEAHAFAKNSFTKLVLPASLVEIEPQAFSGCYSLRTIEVAEGNPRYYSEGGCVIDREKNAVVIARVSEVTVPHGVSVIETAAFQNYSGSTISIPTSVLSIATGYFRNTARYDANHNELSEENAKIWNELSPIVPTKPIEVDYEGSDIMWSVLPRYATFLGKAKADCKGKDADTLAAADFDGDGIIRVRDVLRAINATEGNDIDGDGAFTQTDVIWILLLCTAK